jgi:hypothetical protein
MKNITDNEAMWIRENENQEILKFFIYFDFQLIL